MKRLAILLSAVVFAAVFAALSISALGEENPTLSVVGEGTVSVPADTVIISVAVESSNENATLAAEENQEKLNSAKDALLASGVKPDEILPGRSTGFSSFQYSSKVCHTVNNTTTCEGGSSNATSQSSSLTIKLKTTDEAKINQVLNAAKSTGAAAAVTGYGLSDSSSAMSEARKKAVEDARTNAHGMAEAAGARLGKVVDISEYAYPEMIMAPPLVSAGQGGNVDVTSYVVATYEIIS